LNFSLASIFNSSILEFNRVIFINVFIRPKENQHWVSLSACTMNVFCQFKWNWSAFKEIPILKCFKVRCLISIIDWCFILIILTTERFIPHNRWESSSVIFCTFWISYVSYVHMWFLCLRIILKIIEEWNINSFVERMVFWSKIKDVKLLIFLLHFGDYFAFSWLMLRFISNNNSIIKAFFSSNSIPLFKVVSISIINTKDKI